MADIKVEVKDNSPEFLKEFESAVEKILEEWGLAGQGFVSKEALGTAVYDTPPSKNYNRTGRLRGSITYATSKKRSDPQSPAGGKDGVQGSPDERSVFIGTNVEYAAYVELGTSKMRPRPYLKPGIENNRDKFKSIMEKYL